MPLSREELLGFSDRDTKEIQVPDWIKDGEPVTVLIRKISAAERDNMEAIASRMELTNYRAKCCLSFLSDAEGKPLLKPVDLQRLGERSGIALDCIHEAGVEFNCMGSKAASDAKKNSETTPDDDSA